MLHTRSPSLYTLYLVLTVFPVVHASDSDVELAISRSSALEQAGSSSEATSVLAQAFSTYADFKLLDAWIQMDKTRLRELRRQVHDQLQLPQLMDAAEIDRRFGNNIGEEWSQGSTVRNLSTLGLAPIVAGGDRALKEYRSDLEKKKPVILSDQVIASRMASCERLGDSVLSCETQVIRCLKTENGDRLQSLITYKNSLRDLMSQVRSVREDFVTNDYIGPKIYDASIKLSYDEFHWLYGPRVSEGSLRQAAARLGEVRGDIAFASKDLRQAWLNAYSQLKKASGSAQFEELEAIATIVADPSKGPEKWKQ